MFAWLSNPKDPLILDRLFKLYDFDKDGKVTYINTQMTSNDIKLIQSLIPHCSFQEVAVTLGLLSHGAPGEKVSVCAKQKYFLLSSVHLCGHRVFQLLFLLFDEDRDDKLSLAEVSRLVTYIKLGTSGTFRCDSL